MKQKIFTCIIVLLSGITAVYAQTSSTLSTLIETEDGWKVVKNIVISEGKMAYTLWDESQVCADVTHGSQTYLPVVSGALYCVPGTLTRNQLAEADQTGALKMFGKVNQDDLIICHLSTITSADLSHLDMSDVTWLQSLFEGCTALKRVDFGGNIHSNVTSLRQMFMDCTNLEEVDFSGCDFSGVTDDALLLNDCPNLKTIKAIGCNEATISLLQECINTWGYPNVQIITSEQSETDPAEMTE